MQKKKILITGGAGFIGSGLALKLKSRGHEVTVLDNLSQQVHGKDPAEDSPLYKRIKDEVKFIRGDVTKQEDLAGAIGDNEVIVHLAAETGTGQSMYQVAHYVQTNIGGTAILLDILTNHPTQVKRVIVASSRAIYGEGKYLSEEQGYVYPGQRNSKDLDAGRFDVTYPGCKTLSLQSTDEDSKIHPASIYGITKQNQEQMVLVSCAAIGIAALAFRYQNVYGPGQSLSNPYTGILSIFSTQIKNGLPINIFEDGKESRDFVYIDDVIDATVLGIENDAAKNMALNVGSGVPTTVLKVAETLMHHYGTTVPLTITGNYRMGDIRHNYADLSRINSVLGFRPKVDFMNGIKHFCDWVNGQQVQQSSYAHSLTEMKQKGLFR